MGGNHAPAGVDAFQAKTHKAQLKRGRRVAQRAKLVDHLRVHLGTLEDEWTVGFQCVKGTLQEGVPGLRVGGDVLGQLLGIDR